MWGRKVIKLIDYVPLPNFKLTTEFEKTDTSGIIATVLKDDRKAKELGTPVAFAQLFECRDEYDTCMSVYDSVKHNIKYTDDPEGHEIVKMPNALLYYKKGNCKSFSPLIAYILRGVHGGKIKCRYRFVSQDYYDKTPTHVFIVCTLSDGSEVIMDAVYRYFDRECFYWHHQDFDAA